MTQPRGGASLIKQWGGMWVEIRLSGISGVTRTSHCMTRTCTSQCMTLMNTKLANMATKNVENSSRKIVSASSDSITALLRRSRIISCSISRRLPRNNCGTRVKMHNQWCEINFVQHAHRGPTKFGHLQRCQHVQRLETWIALKNMIETAGSHRHFRLTVHERSP